MLKRAYVEITNRCNLRCSFCPGTRRAPRDMTEAEFAVVLDKLRPFVSYVYLHVMGEPLLHPGLEALLELASERTLNVCITTNGTLLTCRSDALLQVKALYKISVSLHSAEGNGAAADPAWLASVWDFVRSAAARGVICALRLWNEGGADAGNAAILDFLREKTGRDSWPEPRARSFRLGERLYLEREPSFVWPDPGAAETCTQFCRALRDQLGVLADGTVVPCCLDHEGELALGNIFRQELAEILCSERARAIREGFSRRRPAEELCRRCGYAARFNV